MTDHRPTGTVGPAALPAPAEDGFDAPLRLPAVQDRARTQLRPVHASAGVPVGAFGPSRCRNGEAGGSG
ncbi:hypothetical protein CU044_4018 [Streptomyces sp. L-9-10]|nr:hypothetical protein CU044_4018 [Streptomyces sp. L-9-10]